MAAKTLINPETKKPWTDDERLAGALFIVLQLWQDSHTNDVKKRLGGREPAFITMPSTTGQNLLPKVLGQLLHSELGGNLLFGNAIASSMHVLAMKDVPAESRPFIPREYMIHNPRALQRDVAGKAVVVVEDVFSSGASAKAFCDALSECTIQVTTVAGLLGDSRLAAEPQMIQKLSKALKRINIDCKARDVAAVLSRGQIATLIDILNTRGSDERDAIAEGIQRVLNSRIARHLGECGWRAL